MSKISRDFFRNWPEQTYTSYIERYDQAKRHGHKHWILDDSIPVTYEFKKLFEEVNHKFRGDLIPILRGANAKFVYTTDTQHPVYIGFAVSFKNAPDTEVGKLRVVVDSKGELKYEVVADSIVNARYSANRHSEEAHTKSSVDIKKIVAQAKQHLKRPDFVSIKQESAGDLHAGVRRIIGPAFSSIRYAVSIPMDTMIEEMLSMHTKGYTFHTKAFNDLAQLLSENDGEVVKRKEYSPQAVFVWFSEGAIVYECQAGGEVLTAHTLEELPQHLRDKLAVLALCAVGEPIKDVGVRINDHRYWLFL